eukprot:g11088.t1
MVPETEEAIDARDVAITKPKEDEESVATDGPISRGQNLDVPVSPSERHCATPSSAATVDVDAFEAPTDGIGAELVSAILDRPGSRTAFGTVQLRGLEDRRTGSFPSMMLCIFQ